MKNSLRVLCSAVALLAAMPAIAQFPGEIPDNVRFRLGGIFASLDTRASLTSSDFPGTDLDLQRVLGEPDHRTAFRGEGYWNFLGRSYLDFGYVNFVTDSNHALTQDIRFGGVTYTAGAQVANEAQARFAYAAFRYGIIKNPSFHLGASLGVSYVTLRNTMTAAAGVRAPDGTEIVGSVTREAKLDVPVPLLGLELEARIAGPVSAGVRVHAIKATVDPWSGSMVEALAHVDWYPAQNFGLGGAYEYTRINVEKTNDVRTLKFNYRYDGPRVYVVVTF